MNRKKIHEVAEAFAYASALAALLGLSLAAWGHFEYTLIFLSTGAVAFTTALATRPVSTERQAKLDSRRRSVSMFDPSDDTAWLRAERAAEQEIMRGEHSLWGKAQAAIDSIQAELDAEERRRRPDVEPLPLITDFCPGGETYSDDQVTYGRNYDDIRRSFIDCPGGQPHWHPRVRVI